MKTIQIPSPSTGDKPKKACVDFGDELDICFADPGTFTPDANGEMFNPPLVAMTVEQWQLAGPYYAPEQKVDVAWTFTPLDHAAADSGTIEVKQDATCRDTTQPVCGGGAVVSGVEIARKTIQIPGSRALHDDEVGYGCLVDLHFTEQGVFWRSKEGNYFTPPMFWGLASLGSDYESTSPDRDLVVRWRFIAADGTETDGRIRVKEGASCADTAMEKQQ